MERRIIDSVPHIVGYHTQEFRPMSQPLEKPVKCIAKNAWLGIGFYFWTEIEFAHYWGLDFKIRNTGSYDVYIAHLDTSTCVNSVFDEEGYFFYKEKIEETINHFQTSGMNVSLEQVNRFLSDNIWPQIGVEGIIFDDKPTNPGRNPNRVYSLIPELYYKKRIQIVMFNTKRIRNFAIHLENVEQPDA
ncbi:hypothetical protein [Dyadobacter chenhuakuii]|uniref:Uncharacterized protein n=1 Tax=Dyadobacter chenhuakuii TaxID=2909339 RepID=A0ABY4XIC2_9BACT|nr:hypothetical protein [Dyadobacter chenhuakuii]MCF2496126.1 hypothetical protein [Dyadobacter chenhuakuii]USJ30190.1 hypothetical protein NFI80_20285 [Dyadobacter chenhuakuii]